MRKSIARALVPIMAASMLLAGGAAPANATKAPTVYFDVVVPKDVGCPGFALGVAEQGGKKVTKVLKKDAKGNPVHQIVTGTGVDVIYRNYGSYDETTGAPRPKPSKTVTVHTKLFISDEYTRPDGSSTRIVTGESGLVLYPGDIPAGPSATQYIGLVVFDITAAGITVVKQVKAKKRNICAELSR